LILCQLSETFYSKIEPPERIGFGFVDDVRRPIFDQIGRAHQHALDIVLLRLDADMNELVIDKVNDVALVDMFQGKTEKVGLSRHRDSLKKESSVFCYFLKKK